jgi:hypothetical protein
MSIVYANPEASGWILILRAGSKWRSSGELVKISSLAKSSRTVRVLSSQDPVPSGDSDPTLRSLLPPFSGASWLLAPGASTNSKNIACYIYISSEGRLPFISLHDPNSMVSVPQA